MRNLNLSPKGGPKKKKGSVLGGTMADKQADIDNNAIMPDDQRAAIQRYNKDRGDRGGKGFMLSEDAAGYERYKKEFDATKRYKEGETSAGKYGENYIGTEKDGTEYIARGSNVYGVDGSGNISKGKNWHKAYSGDKYGDEISALNSRDIALPDAKVNSKYNKKNIRPSKVNPLKSVK